MLARALRSLLNQTWQDFQVVVCDNHSDDATADVVGKFSKMDSRIVYHCQPTNIGAQANFGWAFSQVRSEYFCLFSDDDILLPDCLTSEVEGLRQHPEAQAWGGVVLATGEDGSVSRWPPQAWPEGFSGPQAACDLICRNLRPANTGMLFRSSVLDSDFHPGYPDFHCSDVLWMLHAAAKGGIGITNQPVAVFLQHAGSLSTRAGHDPEKGMELYWPSVLYLLGHFPQGKLSVYEVAEFRRTLRFTYGVEQFRHLGRMAAIQGRQPVVSTCIRRLEDDFQDHPGILRLRRLSALPRVFLRLYFGIRYRIMAMKKVGDRRERSQDQQIALNAICSSVVTADT